MEIKFLLDEDVTIVLRGLLMVPQVFDYLDEDWTEFLRVNLYFDPGASRVTDKGKQFLGMLDKPQDVYFLNEDAHLETLLGILKIYPLFFPFLDETIADWLEDEEYFDSTTNAVSYRGQVLLKSANY